MASFLRGVSQGLPQGYQMGRQARQDAWLEEQQAAWRQEQAGKEALKQDVRTASTPAEVQSRVGLQVTDPATGQTFYAPQEAAGVYGERGYTVGTEQTPYQDVSAGSRTVGLGQYSANDGPPAGNVAANAYNEEPARLARMRQVYLEHDKPEKAAAMGQLGMQPIQMAAAKQQLELGGLQLGEAQSRAAARARVDQVIKTKWADPAKTLLEQFNTDFAKFGEGNNAGKRMNAVPMPDGSGDHLVWQVDEKGQLKGSAKVMPAAQIQAEANKAMLADLAAADPEKYLDKAIDAGFKVQQLKETAKQHEETARHNLATEDLTAQQRAMESKKLDMHYKSIMSQLGRANAASELASYQLAQQKKFDAAREGIMDDLDAKKLTPAEAERKLGMLQRRFGSGGGLGGKPPAEDPVEEILREAAKKDVTVLPQYEAYRRQRASLKDGDLTSHLAQGAGKKPPASVAQGGLSGTSDNAISTRAITEGFSGLGSGGKSAATQMQELDALISGTAEASNLATDPASKALFTRRLTELGMQRRALVEGTTP